MTNFIEKDQGEKSKQNYQFIKEKPELN